jgi:hypothetical protein
LVDALPAELPALFRSQWPAYRQVLNYPLPQFANNPNFEQIDVDASISQIAKSPALRRMPLVVLSKTKPVARPPGLTGFAFAELERLWPVREQQAALTADRHQRAQVLGCAEASGGAVDYDANVSCGHAGRSPNTKDAAAVLAVIVNAVNRTCSPEKPAGRAGEAIDGTRRGDDHATATATATAARCRLELRGG